MEDEQKQVTESTAKRLVSLLDKVTPDGAVNLAKKPILHIRNSQIAAGITGSIGLIMFALGIENLIRNIPGLSSPFAEIIIGLILLSISGLLLKKLI